MKLALRLAIAATLVATPALASDLVYPGGTALTEGVAGKPYWALQANCAGIYGAASAWRAESGDSSGAAEAKAQGVAFFNQAVDRVMKDRGLARPAAIDALGPTVVKGRGEALDMLKAEGDGPTSKWNFARSACLDVRDAYNPS